MTENEPAWQDLPTAGEIGVHRRPIGEPLINPGDSRNMAPQRLDGPEVIRIPGEEPSPDGSRAAPAREPASGGPAVAADRPGSRPKPIRASADEPSTRPASRGGGPMLVLAAAATFFLVLRRLLRRRGRARPAPTMRRLPLPEGRRRRSRTRWGAR
jgi:hypothetical protein